MLQKPGHVRGTSLLPFIENTVGLTACEAS
jgi:hypothetical protein